MQVITKFNLNQKVRRNGTIDVGYVYSIFIAIERDGKPSIQYEVEHFANENLHVGADFGGGGYESEFKELE